MTSIGPYASVGLGRPSLTRAQSDLRSQIDDLTQQLSTGKKATTYAGLGAGGAVSLSMRARLASAESYQAVGDTVGVRVNMASTALTGLEALASQYKTIDSNSFDLTTAGLTVDQSQAAADLQEAIAQLNVEVGGRYLFSGRSTDVKPVLTADKILSDDGDKAGLKTVIAERKLADLGADGRGRLDVSDASGGTFTVSQEASGPFGFKLTSVSSTLTGGVAEGPAGDPATVTLGATGTPLEGETVTVGLTLPDGTTEQVTLTARAGEEGDALEAGAFRIGATPEETAANLRTAFDASLKTLGSTALTAASAVAAGEGFFGAANGAEPARVAGFDGTYASDAERVAALQNASAVTTTGTADKTVSWYQGEDAGDDPRKTATASVDDGVTVAYGARANEAGPTTILRNLAVFSAVSFSPADDDAKARYAALASRTANAMGATETTAAIKTMAVDLATANSSIKAADDRHDATKALAESAISGVENVSKEEVTLKILALQTSLQASYQVTATLKQLSLVNFL
ncbi:hypothetical protein ACFQ4O_08065 [Methylopila musalis]|uniref:Flagellin N-terminal domain-containing protein n=1 Tax=Methylopila musalis TaxID=1134781 RepID=A0ABW3Z706_9HYPH